MGDTVPAYDFQDRQENNFDIQPERALLQIIGVELHLHVQRQLITAIDLGPASQSGRNAVHALGRTQGDQIVLVKQRRPWSNDTHVATQDTP